MEMDVNDVIGKVRLVRARIEEIEARHKEELKDYIELESELLNSIMRFLQVTNQQNAKTPSGTAYLAHKESFKVEDQAEFRHHVIGTEAWELIEWRANRTGVRAFEEKFKELPPGMTKSVLLECRVLAPEKPRLKKPTQVEHTQEQAGPTGFD
jgi:hypothetical protein